MPDLPGATPAAVGAVAALLARGELVGAAESLTGGLLCAALTAVPGASAVVAGGVVAYLPQVKERVLGVPASVIAEHGTVSRECALAMARGCRRVLGADWALATTGVAGPEPSEGHPVGTVHLALVGEQQEVHRALILDGDRDQIRAATVGAALRLLTGAVAAAGTMSAPDGTVEA